MCIMEEKGCGVGPRTKLDDQRLFVVTRDLMRLLLNSRKRKKALHAVEKDHLRWREGSNELNQKRRRKSLGLILELGVLDQNKMKMSFNSWWCKKVASGLAWPVMCSKGEKMAMANW